MKAKQFRPTAWRLVSFEQIMKIQIVQEQGVFYVYSALFDPSGVKLTPLIKSLARENRGGHIYFMRDNQRYYLSDFTSKAIPNKG